MSGEHDEQVLLFSKARLYEGQYPELVLLFAIPNGGLRNKVVAKKLKAEGVKAGVLDVCLPVPRGRYHGLYIEMKHGRNKPTKAQRFWIDALRLAGHRVEVCYSGDAA